MLGFTSNPKRREEVNGTRAPRGVGLPPELIDEVLSRLPAKTIGRFRSACKRWHSLLYDTKFLKLQFSRNRDSKKLIFAFNCSMFGNSFYTVDFRKGSYSNSDKVVAIENLLNFKLYDLSYRIEGSCNGLLLLSRIRMSGLFIVNPITCETLQLPYCFDRIYSNPGDEYQFCYDARTDDYIVVLLCNLAFCTTARTMYMFKRNRWKKVEDFPCYGECFNSAGIFTNGAIHWLGYRISDGCKVICAFDLAEEKFWEVELPDEYLKRETTRLPRINVLGGCPRKLFFCDENIDIWVMEEYGVKESWIKYSTGCRGWHLYYRAKALFALNDGDVFDVVAFFHLAKTLFSWDDGDVFDVVAFYNQQLFLCNFKEKTFEEIEVQGVRFDAHYGHVWTFAESLFSPNYYFNIWNS